MTASAFDGDEVVLWHEDVHRYFDEELYYFLIGLSGYHSSSFEEINASLKETFHLSGFCLYPTLGSTDVILRIWLNRVDSKKLLVYLDERKRIGEFRDYFAFQAKDIYHWPFEEPPRVQLGSHLSSDYARAQEESGEQRERMEGEGLLHVGPISDSSLIKFYLTIGILPVESDSREAIFSSIKRLTQSHPLENVSLYRGEGFCSILLKALAPDVPAIFEFATSLREVIAPYRMLSSTFVVSTKYATEVDYINASSLLGLPRFDPACMEWVPEMYSIDSLSSTGREKIREVETFLTSCQLFTRLEFERDWMRIVIPPLVHQERDADKSYSGARLVGSKLAMIEHWLRTNMDSFLRALADNDGNVFNKLSKDANVPKDQYGSLGQYLRAYGSLLRLHKDTPTSFEFTGEAKEIFNKITQLRNDCYHTDGYKVVDDWTGTLRLLGDFFPVYWKLHDSVVQVITAANLE